MVFLSMFSQNPPIGSGDRVQTRLICTVFIVWWLYHSEIFRFLHITLKLKFPPIWRLGTCKFIISILSKTKSSGVPNIETYDRRYNQAGSECTVHNINGHAMLLDFCNNNNIKDWRLGGCPLPRLIWAFVGARVILLVLSCCGLIFQKWLCVGGGVLPFLKSSKSFTNSD